MEQSVLARLSNHERAVLKMLLLHGVSEHDLLGQPRGRVQRSQFPQVDFHHRSLGTLLQDTLSMLIDQLSALITSATLQSLA